jgi:plasmid stability protein
VGVFVANLTISIEDEVLKKARMRALEEGTSVNALLREYLERFTAVNTKRLAAADKILAFSAKADSRRGAASWVREELHD